MDAPQRVWPLRRRVLPALGDGERADAARVEREPREPEQQGPNCRLLGAIRKQCTSEGLAVILSKG